MKTDFSTLIAAGHQPQRFPIRRLMASWASPRAPQEDVPRNAPREPVTSRRWVGKPNGSFPLTPNKRRRSVRFRYTSVPTCWFPAPTW